MIEERLSRTSDSSSSPLSADPKGHTTTSLPLSLTPMQSRVLSLLATGLTPKQAARESQRTIHTIRSHIAAAKRSTGARTLHQLVGMFVEARAATDSAESATA